VEHEARQGSGRTQRIAVRRWPRAAGTAGVAVLLTLSGLAVSSVEAAPDFDIMVSTDESGVLVSGPAVGATVSVKVFRNDAEIGTASGIATDLGAGIGGFTLNHQSVAPAVTPCWDVATPDILAGDVVEVTSGSVTETVHVAGVEITERPTMVNATTATIRGNVAPMVPLADLSVEARGDLRVVAPGQSTPAGVTGSLAWDTGPGARPGDFVATFTGFQPGQLGGFLGSLDVTVTHTESESAAGEPSGTVAVLDADPGPGAEECPPLQERAVKTLSHGMVNIATRSGAWVVGGVSVGASAVEVTIADSAGAIRTAAGEITPVAGGQTWLASFPAGALLGLADGPVTVSATYDEGGAVPQTGRSRTIWKDTVAPAAPDISPQGGEFSGSRDVTLAAAGAEVVYTTDGTNPGPTNGVTARGPVRVTESLTLRAVAIDPSGNIGPVAQAVFTRVPAPAPPAPPAPAPPGKAATAPGAPKIGRAASGSPGGKVTAVARWTPGADGGSRITGYALTALRIVHGKVVAKTTVTLPGTARVAQIRLRKGTYRFQLRAVNAVGRSGASARSNSVKAR
jgi:hypothetical protein